MTEKLDSTGNGNTGHCNTGDRNTGDRNTGNFNTGIENTGKFNTGDRNTGNFNTGEGNTGNFNTGEGNTGNRNTGNFNTGNWNTGNWNTGDRNTGYFNSVTPEELWVFNKPCSSCNWKRARIPTWMYVRLTKWVSEEDMSEKEKKAYPSYTTTGGYLKVYQSLKHAYVESWEKACQADRDLTKKLPNFDPEVFREVFGFSVDYDPHSPESNPISDEIVLNGIRYRKVTD